MREKKLTNVRAANNDEKARGASFGSVYCRQLTGTACRKNIAARAHALRRLSSRASCLYGVGPAGACMRCAPQNALPGLPAGSCCLASMRGACMRCTPGASPRLPAGFPSGTDEGACMRCTPQETCSCALAPARSASLLRPAAALCFICCLHASSSISPGGWMVMIAHSPTHACADVPHAGAAVHAGGRDRLRGWRRADRGHARQHPAAQARAGPQRAQEPEAQGRLSNAAPFGEHNCPDMVSHLLQPQQACLLRAWQRAAPSGCQEVLMEGTTGGVKDAPASASITEPVLFEPLFGIAFAVGPADGTLSALQSRPQPCAAFFVLACPCQKENMRMRSNTGITELSHRALHAWQLIRCGGMHAMDCPTGKEGA